MLYCSVGAVVYTPRQFCGVRQMKLSMHPEGEMGQRAPRQVCGGRWVCGVLEPGVNVVKADGSEHVLDGGISVERMGSSEIVWCQGASSYQGRDGCGVG